MTTPEDGPTPLITLISRVWAAVGALALVVALVTTSIQVGVFGGLALVAAGVLYGLQSARDRSAERAQRVLHPPMPAPAPRASDVRGGASRSDPAPEDQPAAPAGGGGGSDEDGGTEETPHPPPRSGPRPRPEPDVPRTARNRGRRNPTAGRHDPTPRQETGPAPADVDESAEETDERLGDGTGEAEVVDEPERQREPDDAEISDAETVDDPPEDRSERRG